MSATPKPIEIPEGFDATVPHCFLWVRDDDVVVGQGMGLMPQAGGIEVSAEIYSAVMARGVGRCRLVGGEVEDYEPPAEPEQAPEEIAPWQFYSQLAAEGVITQDEALEALDGAIPAALNGILDQLPADQRFGAKMKVKGAKSFQRHNDVTLMVQQAMQWPDDKLDTFWLDASKL